MIKKKIEELESYFKQFPDVPKEVVVKEDLLRLGVRFSDSAIELAKNISTGADRGVIFSIAKVKYDELDSKQAVAAPLSICIEGGEYGLRRTIFENRLSLTSPYIIDVIDGKPYLLADEVIIGNVKFPTMPEYYNKRFEDGTWYHEIMPMNAWTMFAFDVAIRFCQLWGKKVECQFCDINNHARQKLKDGTDFSTKKSHKSAAQIAQVAEEIFLRQKQLPSERTLAVFITGGTIMQKVDGMDEDAFYLSHVEAIREKIGHRWPIILQTQAKDKESCKRYRNAGVDTHCANIEVWDKKLFEWICPGKDLNVGRDEWIKRVVESVDIFGEGHVAPNLVTGVEMAKPYGFKTVAEAVKSTTEGLEYLMSHGVVPKFDTWNVSPWSGLAGNVPPPLEYYIRIDQAWCEIWEKYSLPPVDGMGPMGPGRAREFVGAFRDTDSVPRPGIIAGACCQ